MEGQPDISEALAFHSKQDTQQGQFVGTIKFMECRDLPCWEVQKYPCIDLTRLIKTSSIIVEKSFSTTHPLLLR